MKKSYHIATGDRGVYTKKWNHKELTREELSELLTAEPKRDKMTVRKYHKGGSAAAKLKNLQACFIPAFWPSDTKHLIATQPGAYRQMLVIDIDNVQGQSMDDILAKIATAAKCRVDYYTSISHTPENPRFRVIVTFGKQVPANLYRFVAAAIVTDWGISDIIDYKVTISFDQCMFYGTALHDAEFLAGTLNTDKRENLGITKYLNRAIKELEKRPTTENQSALERDGLIGTFNRSIGIEDAINEYGAEFYIKGHEVWLPGYSKKVGNFYEEKQEIHFFNTDIERLPILEVSNNGTVAAYDIALFYGYDSDREAFHAVIAENEDIEALMAANDFEPEQKDGAPVIEQKDESPERAKQSKEILAALEPLIAAKPKRNKRKPVSIKAWNKSRDKIEDLIFAAATINWGQFDHINAAQVPADLDLIHLLEIGDDFSEFETENESKDITDDRSFFLSTDSGQIAPKTSFYINNGKYIHHVFYGSINYKESQDGKKAQPVAAYAPGYIQAVIDYLAGRLTNHANQWYFINGPQLNPVNVQNLAKYYRIGSKSPFNAEDLMALLTFLNERLQVKPARTLYPHRIAGKDFIIDLETGTILREQKDPAACYFKFFKCKFDEVAPLVKMYDDYLNFVINDLDSLHNAKLQTIYTMLVAAGLQSKQNFFISKSTERTGKGLRHLVMESIFNTKRAEIGLLSGGGFEALTQWASLDGGELLLSIEAGAVGAALERPLKILATEKSHPARVNGGITFNAKLTGVLSIDSNEDIILSKGMLSRVVNIAFKNRPADESNEARLRAFKPYWDNFTKATAEDATAPKIEAGVAALIHSLLYFESVGGTFKFNRVEMDNITGHEESLDDFQIMLIELYKNGHFENGFLPVKDYPELSKVLTAAYSGQSKKRLKDNALAKIGIKYTVARIKAKTAKGYKIENQQRLEKVLAALDIIEL